jgi:hypothetical protein
MAIFLFPVYPDTESITLSESEKDNINAGLEIGTGLSWQPVLVVEEAGVPGENHRPWAIELALQVNENIIITGDLNSNLLCSNNNKLIDLVNIFNRYSGSFHH